MGEHFGVGFLTTFLILALCFLGASTSYVFICLLIALFFGMVATCTSMILEKLDAILELTAAQSEILRSLEAKNFDSKASSDD